MQWLISASSVPEKLKQDYSLSLSKPKVWGEAVSENKQKHILEDGFV